MDRSVGTTNKTLLVCCCQGVLDLVQWCGWLSRAMVSLLETCYVILSILPALVRLSCDYSEEGYTNISGLLGIEPVGRHVVGIFWGQLLGNIPQECVELVELRDGTGLTVEVVKSVEEIRNKKPFTVDMNICEERKLICDHPPPNV